MTKKEIAEKSRKAFEKARRGEFRSRPITAQKRVEYLERLEHKERAVIKCSRSGTIEV